MLKFPKTGKRFDNAIPHRAKPNFLGTIINKIMHEKKINAFIFMPANIVKTFSFIPIFSIPHIEVYATGIPK